MQVFVLLPAAGLGTRMAASQPKHPNNPDSASPPSLGTPPKQFLALDGIPILIHSLRAFAAVERVTGIYVAVRKPEMERVETQVAEYGFATKVHVVEGGDNRQESVAHALAAVPAGPEDIVLVHDAVRPLIDAATIERTIDAVSEYGAAIVGLPAVDTIKQVERTAHGALIPRPFRGNRLSRRKRRRVFASICCRRRLPRRRQTGLWARMRLRWWSGPDFL